MTGTIEVDVVNIPGLHAPLFRAVATVGEESVTRLDADALRAVTLAAWTALQLIKGEGNVRYHWQEGARKP